MVFTKEGAAQHGQVGVAAQNQFMKALHQARFGVGAGNVQILPGGNQFGLADQLLGHQPQGGAAILVLVQLVLQNPLDGILLGEGDVLLDVFVGLLVQP